MENSGDRNTIFAVSSINDAIGGWRSRRVGDLLAGVGRNMVPGVNSLHRFLVPPFCLLRIVRLLASIQIRRGVRRGDLVGQRVVEQELGRLPLT